MALDSQRIKERAYQYYLLMRFDKPVGIFLLLWPTLWALWLASEGQPDWHVLAVFVIGVVLMRAAGCVINDFADRDIDPYVKRTQQRPIASGKVTPREALILFTSLCIIAFALVLTLDRLTILLSFVALFLAATYPFVKRYTYLPQVYLGMAFGWAVPMAYTAQLGQFDSVAWLLFIGTVLWATAYDTMYAMVDREDDIQIGVKSTAVLFGEADRLIIAIIQLLMFVVLYLVGDHLAMGWIYYLGLVLAACLALYQQYLIRERDIALCFKAFLNNNWLGALVFTGIALDYLV